MLAAINKTRLRPSSTKLSLALSLYIRQHQSCEFAFALAGRVRSRRNEEFDRCGWLSLQEWPARDALTVAVSCANRTRKHAASVTAYSVLRRLSFHQADNAKPASADHEQHSGAKAHLRLNQQTSGVNVTASLGGG